jgi:hypothetical protein
MAMADHGTGGNLGRRTYIERAPSPMLKKFSGRADDSSVMADVQFAPPLQRLSSPTISAPPPPPPQMAPAAIAPANTLPHLSARVPVVQDTSNVPALGFQEFMQPAQVGTRPSKRKKRRGKNKRGKKLLTTLILFGMLGGGGYHFRNAAPIQKLLGHQPAAPPLPDVPFVRPNISSAEYTVTLSAVQNGVPNNVTTKVMADFVSGLGQSTVESQVAGTFITTQEIRSRDSIFRPGEAYGKVWSRQPRVPETPSPYDTANYIPMIDEIVDMPLRTAMKPTSSRSTTVNGATINSLTYLLDRAKVPEIAPAIFARTPWLFDVPNATTLTVEVSYDESGLVHHLFLGVDPPQPGTGSDATWVTSYSLDVTSLDAPVAITMPIDVADVPAGTP